MPTLQQVTVVPEALGLDTRIIYKQLHSFSNCL